MCLERLVGHVHGGLLFLSHCHPHPGKLGGPDSIYGALKRQLSLAFPSLRNPAPLFLGWPKGSLRGGLNNRHVLPWLWKVDAPGHSVTPSLPKAPGQGPSRLSQFSASLAVATGPVSTTVVTCLVLCLCLLFCLSRDSLSLGLVGITGALSPPCLASLAKSLVPKRPHSEDPGGCGFGGTLVTPEHSPWSSTLPVPLWPPVWRMAGLRRV